MIWVVGCLGKEWWWTSIVSSGSQLGQRRLGAGGLLVRVMRRRCFGPKHTEKTKFIAFKVLNIEHSGADGFICDV